MDPAELRARFNAIHTAARALPVVPWEQRRDRLTRLRALVRDGRKALAEAIAEDFGRRPAAESELAEVFPVLDGLGDALRQGQRWMRPRRTSLGRWFWPATGRIEQRPLGVVGIVAPWNYPLMLSVGPLTSAFVAGNRAMLKLSEHAPAFAETFAALAEARFDAEELSVVLGGPDTAEAFTRLPFDHLLFTGSTEVGRRVMAAAAPNLTPVTLELGGKSPALIALDVAGARLKNAAGRIMAGKLLNAGQTCIAPDHVFVPEDRVEAFLDAASGWTRRHYPRLAESPHYSRIINDRQFARLTGWLDEAEASGARLVPLTDAQPDAGERLLPPVAVLDAPADTCLMREEIFGPILPILPYRRLQDAVSEIAPRPRPLAFYPFTDDPEARAHILGHVLAGGVTLNDTLLHAGPAALPFGGVGDSGMGAYHGEAGFRRMSHMMPVFAQSRRNAMGMMAPPYGARFRWLMRLMTR
ncbi:aldehyde dehydrogenase family protein [Paracoccus sp. S-4012]|uniref:coniferyl aldehyde dehydrogenase n=1 Tax=Paracoccus sp. S-4012 TaxID=2665648 RepID=UPI0012B14427|nr:coniferyl aldehyde dehydrogenase [Paracoccus sp. S-4012]MRX49300.1 aldehyde dehydrogenase family protein [Paracoccus sp. S-4012]